jgi:phosphoserine phosphatase
MLVAAVAGCLTAGSWAADPLPSWNEGASKRAIIEFVERVAKPGGADFVPPAERIATFDNDGTLWCEQPLYVQAVFMLDRLHELAPQHPEWKTREPFRSLLAGNMHQAINAGEQGIADVIGATHGGVTPEEFQRSVSAWIAQARHPRFNRLYTELVYQPMLELLAYLRANRFKTFIVSGGGVEFMRPWTFKAYGVPPEQVIGSTVQTRFELVDGKASLFRQPKVDFVDNADGKPVAINRIIGRRPIMAFGNSDGDLQMLQWTTSGAGARFGLIVHHTDAEREYAYDRASRVGQLAEALDQAAQQDWTVVSIKTDWRVVFPPGR